MRSSPRPQGAVVRQFSGGFPAVFRSSVHRLFRPFSGPPSAAPSTAESGSPALSQLQTCGYVERRLESGGPRDAQRDHSKLAAAKAGIRARLTPPMSYEAARWEGIGT